MNITRRIPAEKKSFPILYAYGENRWCHLTSPNKYSGLIIALMRPRVCVCVLKFIGGIDDHRLFTARVTLRRCKWRVHTLFFPPRCIFFIVTFWRDRHSPSSIICTRYHKLFNSNKTAWYTYIHTRIIYGYDSTPVHTPISHYVGRVRLVVRPWKRRSRRGRVAIKYSSNVGYKVRLVCYHTYILYIVYIYI